MICWIFITKELVTSQHSNNQKKVCTCYEPKTRFTFPQPSGEQTNIGSTSPKETKTYIWSTALNKVDFRRECKLNHSKPGLTVCLLASWPGKVEQSGSDSEDSNLGITFRCGFLKAEQKNKQFDIQWQIYCSFYTIYPSFKPTVAGANTFSDGLGVWYAFCSSKHQHELFNCYTHADTLIVDCAAVATASIGWRSHYQRLLRKMFQW